MKNIILLAVLLFVYGCTSNEQLQKNDDILHKNALLLQKNYENWVISNGREKDKKAIDINDDLNKVNEMRKPNIFLKQ